MKQLPICITNVDFQTSTAKHVRMFSVENVGLIKQQNLMSVFTILTMAVQKNVFIKAKKLFPLFN